MRAAGLQVDVRDDITPEELPAVLPAYDGMVVRSRTKVRQPLIDVCPNLKVIVRGGVGLDTIDADYATFQGHHGHEYAPGQLGLGRRTGDRLHVRPGAFRSYQASASMKSEKWEKKAVRRRGAGWQDPRADWHRQHRQGSGPPGKRPGHDRAGVRSVREVGRGRDARGSG